MSPLQWTLMTMVLVFGFYMAWNIGANDVANAMGTSVGSRALTLRNAVILAGIFEFLGAWLVGANVAKTVRKGIFDPQLLNDTYNVTDYPVAIYGEAYPALILTCGMLAALLAAGTWLMLASYFGFPVSTTHSIVGAVVGFGCVALGASFVDWKTVGLITAGWAVSPIMSGAISYVLFRYVLRRVFYKRDPVAAARKVAPNLVAMVLVVLIGVVAFKGLKPFWARHDIDPFSARVLVLVGVSAAISAMIGMFVTRRLVRDIHSDEGEGMEVISPAVARALQKASSHLRTVRDSTKGSLNEETIALLQNVERLHAEVQDKVEFGTESANLQKVERIFVFLQILTACFVAFSHGSNDVANAIGPLSAAYQAVREGQVPVAANVPQWALILGGIGIITGLATWGWRVIRTVGERITELTPSRGFSAEFGAAITILLASTLPIGLPVSTTHTLVGAVLGVGMARGLGALNLRVMRDILASWVITIPAGAALAITFFYLLKFFLLDMQVVGTF